jgi:GTP-binding protein Era
VLVAELIREKALWHTHDEVPHSVGVGIDDMVYEKKRDVTVIHATIYVERESQQGILVGHAGEMIKRIGTEARRDLEKMLLTKVFLDLAVKVKTDWRSDATQVRRFGYGEGL